VELQEKVNSLITRLREQSNRPLVTGHNLDHLTIADASRLRNGLDLDELLAAAQVRAPAAVITALSEQIQAMEVQVQAHFRQHPDAEIILSKPGLGHILGARVLGELGDDPHRYASAKARKNYAATSPITRQSGKRKSVMARYVHNNRLRYAFDGQAFTALTASPGARASKPAPSTTRPPPGRSTPATKTETTFWHRVGTACLDARLHKASAGRWLGVISLGSAPDGKRIRRKVSGQSKAEVKAKLQALHDELREGLHKAPTTTATGPRPATHSHDR
jgi:hypothetical protein